MSWSLIWTRITESASTVVTFGILGIVSCWVLYRVLKLVTESYGGFGQAALGLIRDLASEVIGSKGTKPHERINGFLVLALILLSLAFLVFFGVQSVKAMLAGTDPSLGALAGFLICFVVAATVGLLCVRTCAHHREDERRVVELRGRR